jgi:hypothetical protein
MRYDRFGFSWGTDGTVKVVLSFRGNTLSEFTIDDADCDDFIKKLTEARKKAKKAKRG